MPSGPTWLAPGVFVEEASATARPIAGVPATTAAFVGVTARGATRPRRVTSLAEFERHFGPVAPLGHSHLGRAVQGFFANGGEAAWILRAPVRRGGWTAAGFLGRAAAGRRPATGLAALEGIDEILLVAVPDLRHPRLPEAARRAVLDALVAHVDPRRDRLLLLDPAADDRRLGLEDPLIVPLVSSRVAVFGPWLVAAERDGARAAVPASGHVAGAIARHDVGRHRITAPAGEKLTDALDLALHLTEAELSSMVRAGTNPLRLIGGRGIGVWSARTRADDPTWRHLGVRRLAAMIGCSLDRGLDWVVFEPNGPPLWARVRAAVEDFLLALWREGALLGDRPDEAFFVRCDRSTMTQTDIDNGRVLCMIGFAPLRPAEFVILRVGMRTDV